MYRLGIIPPERKAGLVSVNLVAAVADAAATPATNTAARIDGSLITVAVTVDDDHLAGSAAAPAPVCSPIGPGGFAARPT
jgi:hypothetical protein